MNRIFIFIGLVFISFGLFSQPNGNVEPTDTANYPHWIEMMQNQNINFYQTQRAFDLYWQNRTPVKGDGYKVYKRWENFWQTRVSEGGEFPSIEQNINAYQQVLSSSSLNPLTSSTGSWNDLGPTSMPINGTTQPNGLGRVNCVAYHPSNANIIYIGAPSGGLWKTTNGGSSWTGLTDNMPSLGVSSIVVDPANANIIYLGTGDRDGGDAPGIGVYKSVDGGVTWSASNTGMGNLTVGMMIIHPSNSNLILAATSGGIYKTTNAGTSWTRVSASTSHFKDIAFKPGDPTTVYATYTNAFFKSTNTGDSWTQITSGLPTAGRFVIGVSSANANYVYLAVGSSTGFTGLYRSTNSGGSFTTMSTSPNILGYEADGTGTESQAFYDLCIAVDPSNINTLYVGGINIWKSINGGSSWTINAHWVGTSAPAVHADHHWLSFSPLNNRLYNGNDGGLYYTANGGSSWVDISSGLAIAQIYKMGQSSKSKNLVINGYQDNGTAIYKNGVWNTEIGGDGMECMIDPIDTNYIYGALYYGDIRRSTNYGVYFTAIADNGLNGINESGAWVTPYILNAANPNIMYVGYKNVWRSSNVKVANASSIVWTKISTFGTTSNLTDMESSIADPNILYVARGSALFRTDNANATTPTWVTLSAPATITDIKSHPTNSNIIYITAGTNIYKSTNKGSSWTSIKSNLPTVSMNTLVVDTTSNEGIYVGTDVGVFYKDATMTNWVSYSSGLPVAAEITELEIYYGSGTSNPSVLRAATYGRGLWSSDLYSSPIAAPVADFSADNTSPCQGQFVSFFDLSTGSPTSWSWSITPSSFAFVGGTNSSSKNPKVAFSSSGSYSVTLVATNSNGFNTMVKSNYISVGTPVTVPAVENFESFTTGNPGTFANDWTFSNTGSFNWRVNSGSTASAGTGPSFDHTNGNSSGKYLYTEASSPAVAGEIANLISPCVWLPIGSNYQLSFWYHMYGAAITGLHVDIYHNGVWINDIYTINGQQQTSNNSSWLQATTSLSGYAGSTVQVRFRVICGSSFEGDVAIDDVSIGLPGVPFVDFSSSTNNTYTGVPVLFADATINSPTSWQWSFSPNTVSFVNSTSATSQNPQVVFNAAGNYNVQLIASNANGSDTLLKSNYIVVVAGNTLPYSENFQTFTVGTPGALNNGWTSVTVGSFNWTVNSGGTPSVGTGPLNDHTLGTSAGKYLFTEATAAASGAVAELISPAISLNNVSNAELSFWYHMHGAYISALNVDVFTTTWTTIHTITGQQQVNQTDPWLKAIVNLQAYVGSTVKIRFRVVSNGDYRNDIAIDDVLIQQVTPPVNNFPCGAISLNVNSTCTLSTFNNHNSTATTSVPNPPCGGYAGADVWFKFVAPVSGAAIIDAEAATTDAFPDGAMAVYKGNCGNLVYLNCNDDYNGSGNMPYLSLTNLTPGDTIFVRFWRYSGGNTGSFQLCVYEPPYLIISPNTKNVSSALGSTTFQLQTNQTWTATDNVSWAVVSPTSGTGSATLTVNYSANSGAARTATISATNGLGLNATASMIQYSSVVADFSISNAYLCKNSNVTFTNTSVNHTSSQWFIDGVYVGNTANLTYSFSATGIHSVKLKVQNSSNSDSIIKVVYVANSPIANAGSDTAICANGTINLNGANAVGVLACSSSCNMPTYCISSGNNDDFEYIQKVELNGSVKTSANEGIGYNDHSGNLFTVLNIDSTYSLAVTGFVTSGSYLEYVEAFIDWNRNGLFDEPSISLGSATFTGAYLFNGIVTVPNNAVLGKTKMRIILKYAAAVISGCETGYAYGETEDYMVEIVGIGSTSYSWSGPSGFTSLYQNTSLNSVSTANSGNYVFTVTDGFGCSGSDTKVVTVNALPNANFAAINNVCVNTSPFTLTQGTPSGGTYWGSGVSSNSFNPAVAGVGTHTLYYRVINASGCIDTATQTITVNALPSVSLGNLNSACINGSSIVLSSGLPTGGSYSGLGVNQNVFYPNIAGLGTKTITYSYTDNNGCTNTAQKNIIVNAAPTVTLSSQSVACINGGSVVLSGGLPVGGSYFGAGVSNGMFNPTVLGLGNFQIYYTYTNSNGCSDTASSFKAVVAAPSANLSSFNSTCNQAPAITLTGGTPIGGVYIGTGVTNGQFNPSVGVGVYSIGYVVTNSNNCTDTATNTITVNALPTVNIVGLPSAVCDNEGVVNLVGSPVGGQFSGTGVVGSQFNPAVSGTGTKVITYSYTDANSCSNSTNQAINVQPAPIVNAGSDNSINYSTSAQLNGSVSSQGGGGVTIQWKPTNMVVNPTNQVTSTVPLTSSQLFTLVAIKNNSGCNDSDQVMITVTGGPLTLTTNVSTNQICQGDSVQLQAFAGGGSGNYFYSWTFNGNVIGNQSVMMFAPSATGYYKISLTDNLNSKVDSVFITVNPLPIVNFGGIQPICHGSIINLSSGVPSGGQYFGVGVANSQFNSSISGVGSHLITYTYTNSNNCSNSATTNVLVNAKPNVSMSSLPTVCSSSNIIVLNGGQPSGGSYFGNGVSSNQFNPQLAGVGTHSISYVYLDNNNCSDTAIAQLVVQSSPIANAGIDQVINSNSQGSLSGLATGGSGNFNFNWSPVAKVLNASSQNTSTVALSQTTEFTLYVSDNMTSCSDSDKVLIVVMGVPLVNTITSSKTSICEGENVQLTTLTTGGLGNFVYSWSSLPSGFVSSVYNPVVSPSATTKYFVNVSDGFNQILDSIVITVSSIPVVALGNDSLVCGGGTLSLDAGAGSNNYLWSNQSTNQYLLLNLSNLTPGVYPYSVTVTNSGNCSGSDTIVIIKDSKPYVNLGLDDSICLLSSKILDAGYGFSNYLWSTGDTNQIISVDGSMLGLGNHNIWVEVSSKFGCKNADTMRLAVENCQSITQNISDYQIKIFPNPSNGEFSILINSEQRDAINLEVYTLQGALIENRKILIDSPEMIYHLNLSNHSKGVYLLKLTNNSIMRIERIVIQ